MNTTDGSMLRVESLLTEILICLKDGAKKNADNGEFGLLLNAAEAEAFTGIKVTTLYKYAKEIDNFPAIRRKECGGRVFFSRDGLKEWVRKNEGKMI